MQNISEQLRLKRIMSWRKVGSAAVFPETAQPQNHLTLIQEETCKGFSPAIVYKFRPEEAQ
jgi:hypothetical protein